MRAPLRKRSLKAANAPVAQGIEHRFPKPCAQVRILPGAQRVFSASGFPVALFARLVPILSKKLFTVVECVPLCTVTLLTGGSPRWAFRTEQS